MLRLLKKKKEYTGTCADLAETYFESGLNCTQSVLKAMIPDVDDAVMKMAKGFGGGIGSRKCLCGAVSGGVMALGFAGSEKDSGKLVDWFKEEYRVTCCSFLTKDVKWKSKEHHQQCKEITSKTAEKVEMMLG